MRTEIFNSGAPCPDLPSQDVVKDLTHVLLPLKTHKGIKNTHTNTRECCADYLGEKVKVVMAATRPLLLLPQNL